MSIAQDRIPREILAHIFLSCLPHQPLDYLQPDLEIAPMNLCHICSYWRGVALGTPRLWNNLYHISYASEEVEGQDVFRYGIQPIDIEFLRWWAMNIGPLPPTLHLHIESRDVIGLHRSETDVAESNHRFFLGLLTSAQCLVLGHVIRNAFTFNEYVFPNLRSLLILDEPYKLRTYLSDLYTHRDQIYNKVYIETLFIKDSNFGTELPWTYLTHVCIDMRINPRAWVHFMKKLSNLQYGVFQLRFQEDAPIILSDATLPHLRQLSVKCEPRFNASLFKGLTFPALTGFRLCMNRLSIEGLHELLRAAPALTELHLFCEFPFDNDPDDEEEIIPFPAGVDPLSLIIPNLEFLVIKLLLTKSSRKLVEKLINSSWLNLKSEHNRIKNVLFYFDPGAGHSHIWSSINAHLAELQIDGVGLRVYPNKDLSPSSSNPFIFRFHRKVGLVNWDEEMHFYLEHTTQ